MSFLDVIDAGINTYFACRPRRKPPQTGIDQVLLIAHRGAHGKTLQCVENTDAAFALALQLGCWGIELDVHVTADGVVVVNHDPDLKRLWGVDLVIKEISFTQLRACAPVVPSLAEVVERYGQSMHLFIELKAPFSNERALLAALRPLIPCVNYHIISLDEMSLASLSGFPRESLLLVAGHNNVRRFCELSLQKKYGGVLGHYLLLNEAKINQLHSAQQMVGVGFVDSKFSLYREVKRGVSWVFSNNVAGVSGSLGTKDN